MDDAMFRSRMKPKQPKAPAQMVKNELPEAGERVIVVCGNSRYLGYVDERCVWRYDKDDSEITDALGWLPLPG